MSDPERLRNLHAGDTAAFLLDAARSETPPEGARLRALAALGLGTAAAATSATAHAAQAATGTAKATGIKAILASKWLGATTLAVVAVGSAYVVANRSVDSVTSKRSADPAPLVTRAAERPAQEPAVVEAPAVVPEDAVLEESPARTPAVARSGRTKASGLAQEVAALDAVRKTLVAGQAQRSVALLDAYKKRFPSGELAPEALLLHVEALLKSGQRQRAERLAYDFLTANPSSHHAYKIRRLLQSSRR